MKIDKAFQLAYKYYQEGNLQQSANIFKKILKNQPGNIDALHFLGMICYQLGDYDNAIRYVKKEIEITPSNADAYYNMGLVLQAKGLLSESIDYFKKAITLKPHFSEAYYNLGFAYQNTGKSDEAIIHYRKAIQIEPGLVEAYNNLGILLRAKGHLEEAITYFQKALQINPNYADTYNNLGLSLQDKGNIDDAIVNYQKAINLNPDFADAYSNLGIIFKENGQIDEAIINFQKALQINPDLAEVHNNLGNVLVDKGLLDEAITYFQKAITLNPNLAGAYYNLGNIFKDKGQHGEAISYYQKAIQKKPDFIDAYNNLGITLQDKGQFDEAIMCYQKAIELNPGHIYAHNNLGAALQDKGQLNNAITCYQKTLKINPYDAEVHFNLAFTYLLSGNFKEGWKEYGWRWKTKDFIPRQRNFHKPLWDGSDITGKTILLHTEQGFGDAIQFIRYAPLVAQQNATIIVVCQKELVSLFQNVEGIKQVISVDEQLPEQLPAFDVHCPLLSLPLKFNTILDTIPAEIPYIKVNPSSIQKWKDKLLDDNSKFKIGLVWAGSPTFKRARLRECPLEMFSPLSHNEDITFYSLQIGKAAEQAKSPPDGMKFIDYTDEIQDFSDTAAFIMNLDLVITVDTAVAHLAGAMGKPVWTLIPFIPDWRWMLNRDDSPWYPTMRLFRQPSWGDWETVINRIKEELRELMTT